MARIYISPSTQDSNLYAGGLGNEQEHMRDVAEIAVELVRTHGHTVYMGGTVSARTNAQDANAKGAIDYYVAVHSNAGGGTGTECWYYTGSARGKALATAVYERVSRVSSAPDRGVKQSTAYIELNTPDAPACIIEVDFHDREQNAQEIVANKALYGSAVADGILDVAGRAEYPAPLPIPKQTLRPGDSGPLVKLAQKALNNRMRFWERKLVIDGQYGKRTVAAVKSFQKRKGLHVDGMVSADDWTKLGVRV